jgi:hypothetical protein
MKLTGERTHCDHLVVDGPIDEEAGDVDLRRGKVRRAQKARRQSKRTWRVWPKRWMRSTAWFSIAAFPADVAASVEGAK